MRYYTLNRRWNDLPAPWGEAATERLRNVLNSWLGTPYRAGQRVKGRQGGVFCTAFVASVLDELYKRPPTPLPDIPIDAAFHCRKTAVGGFKQFMRSYPMARRVPDNTLEPGDIVVVSYTGGGPGHALIAGHRPATLWEAQGSDVHFTGLAMPYGHQLSAVYRCLDKETWG